jgi:hypothetical protein
LVEAAVFGLLLADILANLFDVSAYRVDEISPRPQAPPGKVALLSAFERRTAQGKMDASQIS